MAGPFKALAAKILRDKAPSSTSNTVASLLGGAAGSEIGGMLGSRVGNKRLPEKLRAATKEISDRDIRWKEDFPGNSSIFDRIQEKPLDTEDRLGWALDALMHSDNKAVHQAALAKHFGKYTKGGNILGGMSGALVAPALLNAPHAARVNRLARKLAIGTGAAGTAGLGGLALYRRGKKKEAGFFSSLVGKTVARLTPSRIAGSVRAGAANKAIQQGTVLANPPAAITGLVDDAGKQMYSGSVGSGVAKVEGLEATQPQGWFFPRAAKIDKGSHYFDAGSNSYLPAQPGQALSPKTDLYRPNAEGVFQKYHTVTAPTRLPKTLPDAPRGVAPVAQPIPPATPAAAATPPAAPPTTPSTPPATPTVPGATGIAATADEVAAAQAAASGPEGTVKKWLDTIGSTNPQAAKFVSEWGPTITMLAAPLIAMYGEKAAMQMAMKQAMEKAVPYAAGGLALGAGFGMLSNGRQQ